MSSPISEGLRLAIFGRPVAHSLSPVIFASLFEAAGLQGTYLRIAGESPAEIFRTAEDLDLHGFNVTAPFKEAVLPLLDDRGEAAAEIHAVNVVRRSAGGWRGDNTDHIGVVRALADGGIDPRGLTAIVLGAGGAARAAAYGLLGAGAAKVTLINRTVRKAREAAGRLGCGFAPPGELAETAAASDILVSCVPAGAGMLEPGHLRADLTVLDADYRGSETADMARARGCRVIDGRDWLIRQALPAFHLVTGTEPPEGEVEGIRRRIMEIEPAAPPHLALIGFMGVGKSTVGKRLAASTGLRFLDTDHEIEREAGAPIPRIFAANGEKGFRARERAVVSRALQASGEAVLALGGGAVLDPSSRALIRRRCRIVWLWAPPSISLERIDPATRPLLAGPEGSSAAAGILDRRLPDYASLSDLVIDTGSTGIKATAERIAHEMDLPLRS